MLRTPLVLSLALLSATVPFAAADGPIICSNPPEVNISGCGWSADPCDVLGHDTSDLKDLCGINWFGCQMNWRDCILDPIKACLYGGSSCTLGDWRP